MDSKLFSPLFNYNASLTYVTAKDWPYVTPVSLVPLFFEVADLVWWQNTMAEYAALPFYVVAVYLSIVFGLQTYMKSREPFRLRPVLIAWNFAMAIINVLGCVRQFQELAVILSKPNGFHRSMCVREELNLPTAFWGLFFCLSKFIFLGDTILIVLTKKKLLFVHLFHHSVALIISWRIFPDSEPICRWIGGSNFFVLFCLYSYFCLKGLNIKIPRQTGFVIALLHVLEMLLGTVVQGYTAVEIFNGRDCARSYNSIKWSFIPHLALLFFFVHLLIGTIQKKKVKTL